MQYIFVYYFLWIFQEENIESDLNESSILEEVNISSASPVESSYEEVEVADQSMQAAEEVYKSVCAKPLFTKPFFVTPFTK